MTDDPELDRTVSRLVEQVEADTRANGSADTLQDLPPEEWQCLLDRIAAGAQREGAILPDGWKEMLALHRDEQRLRADSDDARLAEQGEVFSREDDA